MFLGNNYGIIALNNFVLGFILGGGQLYDKKLNYPDFSLFTNWLGGMWKTKYEKYSMNWSWILLEKFKDDKKALEKFFFYLKKFKSADNEVIVITLTKNHIQYAIDNKEGQLWCKIGNVSKLYYLNLKKVDKIILFRLHPSNTLFSLLTDKNDKVIDGRNIDMTNKILRIKIEKQFGIDLDKFKAVNSVVANSILRRHKII